MFDETKEHGVSVSLDKDIADYTNKSSGLDKIRRLLYEDMIKTVPFEFRHKVQFRAKDFGACWYYSPKEELPVKNKGYYLL